MGYYHGHTMEASDERSPGTLSRTYCAGKIDISAQQQLARGEGSLCVEEPNGWLSFNCQDAATAYLDRTESHESQIGANICLFPAPDSRCEINLWKTWSLRQSTPRAGRQ